MSCHLSVGFYVIVCVYCDIEVHDKFVIYDILGMWMWLDSIPYMVVKLVLRILLLHK
jgi:hypothetical protein